MNPCNRFLKLLAALTAALLLGVFGTPVCFAYSPPPPITDIANAEQLAVWYDTPGNGMAQLTQNIEINRSTQWGSTVGKKGVNAYDWRAGKGYTLRVAEGATLIVDNPKMELGGSEKIITVQNGGTLVLRQGRLGAGVNDSAIAIVVQPGGTVTTETSFKLNGKIVEENSDPPNTILPPDTRIPIASLYDDKAHISCAVGERPDSSVYLANVFAYFGEEGGAELAVEWELSNVDFNKVGTYTVVGQLTQAGLNEHNLSNPTQLTAKMTITVYEPGAVGDARGEVLSVGSSGNTIALLILPALPIEQVTAVYLYHSADGVKWNKATRGLMPDNGVIPKDENFLPAVSTVGSTSYITYHYQTDYRSVWIQAEVVGSDRAGISNAVQLILPEGSRPGDSTSNDSKEDAGDSGGNRGGGGQTEEDRVIPPKPGTEAANVGTQKGETDTVPPTTVPLTASPRNTAEQTATPPLEAAPEEAPPESAAQVLAVPDEAQSIPPPERGQKTSIPPAAAAAVALTGGAGLGGWIFLKKRP